MSYPQWSFDAAYSLALFAHSGQKDKAGKSYILHAVRVSKILEQDPEYMALGSSSQSVALSAAFLHDVLEDTLVTEEMLNDLLCPLEVIKIVVALTHRKNEPRMDYYRRVVEAGPLAVMVKRADILDNLDDSRLALLDEHTQERLRDKYTLALAAISPKKETV